MTRQAHIRIIATGGTIAGRGDSPTEVAYASAQVSADELVLAVPGLSELAEISTETLFALDSKEIGFSHCRSLAALLDQRLADATCDGVVVTHGTDTLEEAAWFLDLVGRWSKPVILVGSMRPATALSADAPANLYQAVSVCADPAAAGRGVMVVMAADILSGWRAVKISATALNGFHAYPGGPIGKIVGESLLLFGSPNLSPLVGRFHNHLRNDDELPFVDIVLLRAGCGDQPLADFEGNVCKGLVVAGFGGGTMPDNLNRLVAETANSGCTVVVSSRVSQATVLTETMTSVKSKNVFPSGLLNPQKSALLLSLALDANLDALEIAELFNVFVTQ